MNHDGHDFDCCYSSSNAIDLAYSRGVERAAKVRIAAAKQAHSAKLKRVTELVEAYACLIKNGHAAGAAEMWKLLGNELDTTD
jgi:hypothetical protein